MKVVVVVVIAAELCRFWKQSLVYISAALRWYWRLLGWRRSRLETYTKHCWKGSSSKTHR